MIQQVTDGQIRLTDQGKGPQASIIEWSRDHPVLLGVPVYFGAARLLGVSEVQTLLHVVRRRS